ncbi:bacteriophage antitermination protein Q [Enterobacter ludwigii]|uniref:bacteriophage antitermination protein Q n=1 Tax=Enterobacter ludwigii TaxID=299767 RepID=UPI001E3039DE|nr:bacteriophage antitermination protein Q [Enterobacter ludwigii]MCE1916547.1 bacteriophage antitermination protein Q [Enterobacter ludwigii]
MNAQQLEYVRIQLRAALADGSGGTKGQLEAFAEHPPADKSVNPRKHIHVVELDNGLGGVHRVKAENSAIYVLETRSRRRPMPPMGDIAFTTCTWRRALLKLEPIQQAWLRYCYGFDLHFELQVQICRHIWELYTKHNGKQKIQKRVEKRLIQLVWLAVQEVAANNINDTYKNYASSHLASFLSIHRDSWYQTYSTPWKEFKHLCNLLDTISLKNLAKDLK